MKSSLYASASLTPFLIGLLAPFAATRATAVEAPVDLIIVAGQSNAVGFNAIPGELPSDAADREIWFWWRCGDPPPDEHDSSSEGTWARLQAQPLGSPRNPSEDRQFGNFAQPSGGFGPEIGVARALAAHGKRRLAVVKVAFSGTGIDRDWNPLDTSDKGACYRALIAEIQAATRAAQKQGIQLQPRAMIWIQGESDANADDAPLYANRLQELLRALRADLKTPGLRATLAVNTRYGTENSFVPTIVSQQQLVAARDPRCAYVDTSAASTANYAHFDARGTLDVGRWMADSLVQLESRLDPDRPMLRIVTFGDSITAGVREGVESRQTFASLWEEQLRSTGLAVHMTNAGRGGETTDQAWERLENVVALRPDVATIMYGTNDSYVDQGKNASRIPLDAYRTNLARIVERFLRAGILPVVMTEPRWADDAPPNGVGENPNIRLESYMQACRDVARERRVPLVDHFAAWTTAREQGVDLREWTTDGYHPNPEGHERIHEELAHQAIQRDRIGVPKRRLLLGGGPVRVICLGDSVTGVYYHTGSRRAYADLAGIALRRLAPEAKVEVINAGVSGNTTQNGLDRLEQDVLSRRPDIVTVMFGLNDMKRLSLDAFRRNLATIVEKCRAAGADVVLATPNNVVSTPERPAEKLVLYCDAVREVGRATRAPVCDVYREFEALRAHDAGEWLLHMSDEIHPNMHGHRLIAEQLAQSITGIRVSLSDASPPSDAAARTLAMLRSGQRVTILAMPPLDQMIESALTSVVPDANLEIVPWQVDRMSLKEIEEDAQQRVRPAKPNLVVLALPRSALGGSESEFVRSFNWTMNWSLSYGAPTWDCVVVHPSVVDPTAFQNEDPSIRFRADLIRRLVAAQDLTLLDRPADSKQDAEALVRNWFAEALHASSAP